RSPTPSSSIFSSFSAITTSLVLVEHELGGRPPRERGARSRLLPGQDDVRRLGAFRALTLLIRDARTLGKRLEAATGDVRVMHEEILRPLVRGDEAIPLRIVEPLDGSGC